MIASSKLVIGGKALFIQAKLFPKYPIINLHSAVCSLPSHKKFRNRFLTARTENSRHTSCEHPRQNRVSSAFARSISTYRVGISVARFEIGHTPRKLPGQPPATFRFNAYLSALQRLFGKGLSRRTSPAPLMPRRTFKRTLDSIAIAIVQSRKCYYTL